MDSHRARISHQWAKEPKYDLRVVTETGKSRPILFITALRYGVQCSMSGLGDGTA